MKKKRDMIVVLILSIACWVIVLLLLPNYIRERIAETKRFGRGVSYSKNASYSSIVREAINFTHPILKKNKIKRLPAFKISYYRHKKFTGIYNGEIVVYINTIDDIPSLVEIVLHEVMHYIQSQTNKEFYLYDEYTRTIGYQRNPFEVESRQFAAEHTPGCIEYLVSRNLIIKH